MFISITLIIVFTYFYVKRIMYPNKKGKQERVFKGGTNAYSSNRY